MLSTLCVFLKQSVALSTDTSEIQLCLDFKYIIYIPLFYQLGF